MRFEEGYLAFEFGDDWQETVIKFDEHDDYSNAKKSLEGMKGVDFLGILQDELIFVEVKDFRGYRIQNKARLATGELMIEVGQKVRDSVACVVGAGRVSSERETWQTYKQFLCQDNGRVRVVLWLEQDRPHRPHNLVQNDMLQKELKRRLKWLGVRINVYSLQQPSNNLDLNVTGLPQPIH
jgi:hypothetical protein